MSYRMLCCCLCSCCQATPGNAQGLLFDLQSELTPDVFHGSKGVSVINPS